MILEEETFEKFGYYPSDLKPKSNKKIVIVCDDCGKKREIAKSHYRSHCLSCAMKVERILCICKQCGNELKLIPSRVKENNFCCRSCAGSYNRQYQHFPTHHTKPERIFEKICKKYNVPFKYTGDGDFWIHTINPDFINCNGKKIAVEIFSYWHDPIRRLGKVPYIRTYEGRKKILKRYGWKQVVFWQEDLERLDAEHFVLIELEKYGIISKDLYSLK